MTVQTNNYGIGASVLPSQNFVLGPPAVADGTLKLQRGNPGATTQDILTVDATGKVTFPGEPAWTTVAIAAANIFASSGTLGAGANGTLRYRVLGKTVFFTMVLNVPNNGTGAGTLQTNALPMPVANSLQMGSGANTNTVTAVVVGLLSGTTQVNLNRYDAAYPIASGQSISVSGFYETT